MKLKSPTEPVLLTDKSFDWLEKKLAKNETRKTLTPYEKELHRRAIMLMKSNNIQCL